MADVKWIKLASDIFNNRKIRQIEALPDGDAIVVIWIKLLCLAGNINDCGLVYFTKEIPYTEEMMATQFGRPLQTVKMALQVFKSFGRFFINVAKFGDFSRNFVVGDGNFFFLSENLKNERGKNAFLGEGFRFFFPFVFSLSDLGKVIFKF